MAIMENPLRIPEIIATVLEFADFKTLFTAAQVNSLWAEYATNNIWRGESDRLRTPDITDALLELIDCCSDERLLWYTRKIRHFRICQIECNERFQSLLEQEKFKFPNARGIDIDIYPLDERHIRQFLTPKVIAVRLESPCGPGALDEIKIHLPSLRSLSIDHCSANDDQMLDFLTHIPSITHLIWGSQYNYLIEPKILHHLAFRPNLKSLSFVKSRILEPIALGHTILPAIQTLFIILEPKYEKYVLPALYMLKNLQDLTLDSSSEYPTLLLKWISISCPRLKKLSVMTEGNLQVTQETFVLLARGCPLLEYIDISLNSDEHKDIFTDECMDKFTSMLPRLEVFDLSCTLPLLSIRSLISFACNCPLLRYLTLPGDFELTSLLDEPSNIIFPSLQTLMIRLAKPSVSRWKSSASMAEIEHRQERLISVFDARFPALTHFFEQLGSKDDFWLRLSSHLEKTAKVNRLQN